jgi:hypothetical protein
MVRAALCLAVCILGLGISASADDHKAHIITFDVPGAGTGTEQGTFVSGINAVGAIVGSYVDGNYVTHGFVRRPDGRITTFDDPDGRTAATACSSAFEDALCGNTWAYGMNTWGVITGGYIDGDHEVFHGYIRTPDGKYTSFDAPQAGPDVSQGTFGYNINDSETISGVYSDSSNVSHIFLRSPDGKFTTFDVPGATGIGTPDFYGLSPRGTIAGSYTNDTFDNFETHGYVRTPDGTYTTFDDPNAGGHISCIGGGRGGRRCTTSQVTSPFSINSEGDVAGNYNDANGEFHGFVRTRDNKFTTYDVPGSSNTSILSNNRAGAITGYYLDSTSPYGHGFVRTASGKTIKFDAPGATLGTVGSGINAAGWVTGTYLDGDFVSHGYVLFLSPERVGDDHGELHRQ